MAIVYYPRKSVLYEWDITSAPHHQVLLSTQPNTILYFGTGSDLHEFSASTIYITSSHAHTSSYTESSSYITLISSSWSSESLSASYAVSASWASESLSASYAVSASWAPGGMADSASWASSSISSSYSLTASWAASSMTSSYSLYAKTASMSMTTSYLERTASLTFLSYSISSSWASSSISASWASSSIQALYAVSASWAPTTDMAGSASWASKSVISETSSYASQSTWAESASWASSSISSSYSLTASLAYSLFPSSVMYASESKYSKSASYLETTAEYAISSSWASQSIVSQTSNYASESYKATYATWSIYADTASYSTTTSYLELTASLTFLSYSIYSVSSSWSSQSFSASYALSSMSASWADTSLSSSLATSASWVPANMFFQTEIIENIGNAGDRIRIAKLAPPVGGKINIRTYNDIGDVGAVTYRFSYIPNVDATMTLENSVGTLCIDNIAISYDAPTSESIMEVRWAPAMVRHKIIPTVLEQSYVGGMKLETGSMVPATTKATCSLLNPHRKSFDHSRYLNSNIFELDRLGEVTAYGGLTSSLGLVVQSVRPALPVMNAFVVEPVHGKITAYGGFTSSFGLIVKSGNPQIDTLVVKPNSGSVFINDASSIDFGTTTRQMLNLYDTRFGIGVENSTTYIRTNDIFRVYKGGVHAGVNANGTKQFEVSTDGDGYIKRHFTLGTTVAGQEGNLYCGQVTRQMINLWQAVYGIGVEDQTLYCRTGANFRVYVGGVHAGAAANGTLTFQVTTDGDGYFRRNLQVARSGQLSIDKIDTALGNTGYLMFRLSGGQNLAGFYDTYSGWVGGNAESVLHCVNSNGGWGWGQGWEMQVGAPPTFYANGIVSAANFVNRSDFRLKRNINTYSFDALDKVKQLRVVEYQEPDRPYLHRKAGDELSDEEKRPRKIIGFIAQEMQQVLPDQVIYNKNDGMLAISMFDISALTVAAVQKLIEKIKTLEEKIAILESK